MQVACSDRRGKVCLFGVTETTSNQNNTENAQSNSSETRGEITRTASNQDIENVQTNSSKTRELGMPERRWLFEQGYRNDPCLLKRLPALK